MHKTPEADLIRSPFGESHSLMCNHKIRRYTRMLLVRRKLLATQSRQTAKLPFSSRWNWDSPTPSPAGECAPTPLGSGRRGGGFQFRRRDINCGALCIYVLCDWPSPCRDTYNGDIEKSLSQARLCYIWSIGAMDKNSGDHKEMSSVLADQQRPRTWVPMRGMGRCGVSANEVSCAHHVTWSPNKLWRSTSILNLWIRV